MGVQNERCNRFALRRPQSIIESKWPVQLEFEALGR